VKRAEALALIGKPVSAWTAANGIYVGELAEVFGSPWRGKVRITGIVEPAQHFERGSLCRRGFRVGETIEVGGSSIRPTDDKGHPGYVEALDAEIEKIAALIERTSQSPHKWALIALRDGLVAARKAEIVRLETGVWKLLR
jgi:hypothetical protein